MFKIEKDSNEVIDVLLDGHSVEILYVDGDYVHAECPLEALGKVKPSDLPSELAVHVHDSSGFGTYLFYELVVSHDGDRCVVDFLCHQPNKYWEHRWGLATFLAAVIEQADSEGGIEVLDSELEDDWKRLELRLPCDTSRSLRDNAALLASRLKTLIHHAEIALAGFIWKKEYETDEKAFCTEVLAPLLRRMGFKFVSYQHGTDEYGRDFTFSELTPFGDYRHYGLQAKAGDISGGNNSQIDGIIGQLKDAFEMPYTALGSKEARYISTFVVGISGRFTANAKEKIVQKVPKGVIGSVLFLDRERIMELIDQYWHTH